MVGKFLVLEGVDGCGKSTQAARLVKGIEASGNSVLHVREPGSTPLGESLRRIILDPNRPAWNPTTEALLFFACRKELLQGVIQPALLEGRHVVCERFTPSTFAYQGQTSESAKAVLRLEETVIPPDWQPDRVLIFDIPAAEALARAQSRGVADGIEQRGLQFLEKVREGFLGYAALHPERCSVLSVNGDSVEEVGDKVLKLLEGFWA
ncbi:MAG TPA: dTMP kinase [Planctomycetes bacterium]|nr:dTMP kinase [Planctomycetota bacterium]